MTPVPVGISNPIAQEAVEEVQRPVKPVAITPSLDTLTTANGDSTITKSGYIHPLDPLTPEEVSAAGNVCLPVHDCRSFLFPHAHMYWHFVAPRSVDGCSLMLVVSNKSDSASREPI